MVLFLQSISQLTFYFSKGTFLLFINLHTQTHTYATVSITYKISNKLYYTNNFIPLNNYIHNNIENFMSKKKLNKKEKKQINENNNNNNNNKKEIST